MTKMPLNGAHRTIGCESCHKNGRFQGASVSCIGCHQKDYAATTKPNHVAAGFPTACEACHRPSDVAFSQARFDHAATFALTGPHATTTCANCHKGNVFKGTPRECIGCHQADFARTQNPNHVAAGFPTACETCHRPNEPTWRTATGTAFNHATFPLTGQHTQQTCVACHRNNVFQGTPRDCVGCHRTAYERTTSPNHVAAGFPTTCETCHRPTDVGWRSGAGAGFNHSQFFPLVGLHQNQSCVLCHKNNVYKGTARDCVGCHRTEYDRTTAPNHAGAGFPTTCENCHRPTDTSWRGAGFNHNQTFPLVGQHATVACAVCHKNNVFKGTARDCVGCHRTDYDRTSAPNHAGAGFPTTCENCHRPTDTSWRGAGFNHSQVFPLVGQHASAACAVCHVNNVYRGTATRLRGLPSHPLRPHDRAEPRLRRILDGMRVVSSGHGHELARRHVQPQSVLRVARRACVPSLCDLPREQRLPGHGPHLRRVSQREIHRHPQPEPRAVGIPDDVRELPPGDRYSLDAGALLPHAIPNQRPTQRHVRAVPHHRKSAGLQLHDVPHAGLDGLPSPGPRRVSLRFRGVLLVPPQRKGRLTMATMRRGSVVLGALLSACLAPAALAATGAAARDATTPIQLSLVAIREEGTLVRVSIHGTAGLPAAEVKTTTEGAPRVFVDLPGVSPGRVPATTRGVGSVRRIRVAQVLARPAHHARRARSRGGNALRSRAGHSGRARDDHRLGRAGGRKHRRPTQKRPDRLHRSDRPRCPWLRHPR